MAKITYQGEAEYIEWYGQRFEKGKAVTVDNEALLAKAQRNPFFKTAAMVDKQTKAEVEADEKARKEALERAEAEEAEEQRRILELNAGDTSHDDADGNDEGEKTSASRRGRPRKS
jgi:hypothetical protein